ncbi:MAG TPA: DegT/DnrJ/EryC1/StrS family aminotransferase [Candidatus Gastranaerophilales bacterium]|nr:DegT/DnrJ/EryC1/StrS family aminotransferase [Candidatus Gastranaerophilales bacterium]
MIPILDLQQQYEQIKEQVEKEVLKVLSSGKYILGENVNKLETDFANYCGVKRAVGVASGTDAIYIALKALDIGPGDEVITTSFTFIATVEAISYVGAKPVFVDIDPNTYNLDVRELEKKITPKTKAIIPVHLYGQPVDMSPVIEAAKKYDLFVIEDCAQSVGASYKGKKTGSFGDIGCFSFFPTKNLGAAGDGGMITTNSNYIADRILSLRNHGSHIRYYHTEVGLNSRLDEIQAAVLNVKFPHLDRWNSKRREAAYFYNELFKDVKEIITPKELDNTECVYHQYTIKTIERDKLFNILKENGVMSMIYYPVPVHLQEAYAGLSLMEGSLPNSEQAAKNVLSLPIFPEITRDQQRKVADELIKALNQVLVRS